MDKRIIGWNPLKAVFFDFDGTLVDSERFYFEAWRPILKSNFAIDLDFAKWIADFAGHTLADNVKTMQRLWGVETSEAFMWKVTREKYAAQDILNIPLMPYTKELIEDLAAREIQIGLVTSNFRTTVEKILAQHQLISYFSLYVTREDVIFPKPDPECYRKALQLSECKAEEVLVIEDTSTGARAAKAAGLACFGVTKQLVERTRLDFVDQLFYDLKEVQAFLTKS